MGETGLWRYARRTARVAWWLVTPWRLPERLAFLRERAAVRERAAEEMLLAEHEKSRVALRRAGRSGQRRAARLVRRPRRVVGRRICAAGDPVAGSTGRGTDGSLVGRAILHFAVARASRSPRALSRRLWRRRGGSFGIWLRGDGLSELGLSQAAGEHLAKALDAGLSEQARQAFLAHDTLATLLPHGLTLPGMRRLFRWFMQRGVGEADLRTEQVWWLFLEAAQDPVRELMLAYAFAPAWQQAHPAGLTVLGEPPLLNGLRSNTAPPGVG